ANPREAREMAALAMEISEKYQVPVILRPAIRVCHARQNLTHDKLRNFDRKASFEKNPARWAATPKFRYLLHGELNQKLVDISRDFDELAPHNAHDLEPGATHRLGVIAGGVSHAAIRDILTEAGRADIPVLKLGAPYPLPVALTDAFVNACDKVLVLEETDALIEYLLRDREKTLGRLSGHVPGEGELTPQVLYGCLNRVLEELDMTPLDEIADPGVEELVKSLQLPIRRPTLCPGCPHRSSFFSIRKARPKAIFTSDIGCYTLGLNLGGVDTCLDMGAAITMASGFYHAFAQDGVKQPIVATMGDSTFFHSGPAGLLNAVYNDARFILVILDNEITAMTGMQPTPGLGIRADGTRGGKISLERVVRGCGVDFIEVVDPYNIKDMKALLKKAAAYTEAPDGGVAVIISRHPCVIAYPDKAIPEKRKVTVTDDCAACNYCLTRFECPALYHDEKLERTNINRQICADCGLCLQICPHKAIAAVDE
ncbi:MAG: indolepyruvate oxidoreductase, partial [Desulfobacterales bacterium]|nr:indolepyruvate oxidoreductase [Desulfobacterales bacterium]